MTLRAFDGFDGYADNVNLGQVQGDWQWGYQVNPTPPIGPLRFVPGRGGVGQALQLTAGDPTFTTKVMGAVGGSLNTNEDVLFYGFAVFFEDAAIRYFTYIDVNIMDWSANQIQFFVRLNFLSGVISVYRYPSTLLGQSTAAAFTNKAYSFIEIGSKIDNATGWVEVRCGGQTVLHLTGIDTQSTANAWQNGLTITQQQFGNLFNITYYTVDIDDFYVCDDTAGGGVIPTNTFLGDCRSLRLTPTADHAVSWSRLSGAYNYLMVHETQFDGDTTYNYTSNVGDQDLFITNSITATITQVIAVQVTIASRQDGAGSSEIGAVISVGGTDYVGTGKIQATGYQFQSTIWYDNPNTSAAWTVSDINGAKIGYKLTA